VSIAIVAQKNALATAYAAGATHAALFFGDPGTTGAATNEVAGSGYARQPITWSTPVNGVMTAAVTFSVPAVTLTFAGVASASTGSTIRDKGPITAVTMPAPGSFTLTLTYTQV
jgi:hypothetical protein